MAITLVPEPTSGAPITASDYALQNSLIIANEVPDLSFLTDWELIAAEPLLKKGVYIFHAGNTYIIDTADEAISASPSAGLSYIELTLTGSTITAAWVTVTTGYTFNPAYGGIYNGAGKQLLPDICYLDGADYLRGRSFGMDYNFVHLANGDFLISGGFDSLGADINTTGGDVNTATGDVNTATGDVNTGGGNVNLAGGNIDSVLSGAFLVDGAFTTGTWAVAGGGFSMLIPKGVFSISYTAASTLAIEHLISAAWREIYPSGSTGGVIVSDGTNYRINRGGGTATTIYYGNF